MCNELSILYFFNYPFLRQVNGSNIKRKRVDQHVGPSHSNFQAQPGQQPENTFIKYLQFYGSLSTLAILLMILAFLENDKLPQINHYKTEGYMTEQWKH